MVTDEKLAMLKEIKRLHEEEGLTYREVSPHFGKKEAWAGVYWRRNEHLHHLLEDVTSPSDTSDTLDTLDTPDTDTSDTPDTNPVISTPEPEVQDAAPLPAFLEDGPGGVTIPTYDEFMRWCKEHSEYIFAAYLWERCEGNPRRPIRSDTMKVLDALRTMLQ